MSAHGLWCLFGRVDETAPARRIVVSQKTFTIGRRASSTLYIRDSTVSRDHAELTEAYGTLWLRDLSSTNGTRINGRSAEGLVALRAHDLVQFGEVAFRVERHASLSSEGTIDENIGRQAAAIVRLNDLLAERQFTPHFQPIVNLESCDVIGLESLARSNIGGLEKPLDMFQAAAHLGLEKELSAVLRQQGLIVAERISDDVAVFVNSHPAEMYGDLEISMTELRQDHPDRKLTIEIHEATVGDLNGLRRLHGILKDFDIQLAFDDFGAGQERLHELITSPPDFLKFDMSAIRGIDHASAGRQETVAALVTLAIEVGAHPLAEGIETREEAEACRELGFTLAQGYYFGRPAPIEQFDTLYSRLLQPVTNI